MCGWVGGWVGGWVCVFVCVYHTHNTHKLMHTYNHTHFREKQNYLIIAQLLSRNKTACLCTAIRSPRGAKSAKLRALLKYSIEISVRTHFGLTRLIMLYSFLGQGSANKALSIFAFLLVLVRKKEKERHRLEWVGERAIYENLNFRLCAYLWPSISFPVTVPRPLFLSLAHSSSD